MLIVATTEIIPSTIKLIPRKICSNFFSSLHIHTLPRRFKYPYPAFPKPNFSLSEKAIKRGPVIRKTTEQYIPKALTGTGT